MLQQVLTYFSQNSGEWLQMVAEHAAMSAGALALAIMVALPLGVLCSRLRLVDVVSSALAGVMRIVPSLAVLIILVPYMGVGELPALVALTVLAIPPILINTAAALRGVAPEALEAARGLGMTPLQIFRRIEVPLAAPLAFAGIRTAATEVIASATLAAYIGAGGLGALIYTGIGAMRFDLLWIGGLSVAVLSVAVNRALALVDRRLRPWETTLAR